MSRGVWVLCICLLDREDGRSAKRIVAAVVQRRLLDGDSGGGADLLSSFPTVLYGEVSGFFKRMILDTRTCNTAKLFLRLSQQQLVRTVRTRTSKARVQASTRLCCWKTWCYLLFPNPREKTENSTMSRNYSALLLQVVVSFLLHFLRVLSVRNVVMRRESVMHCRGLLVLLFSQHPNNSVVPRP